MKDETDISGKRQAVLEAAFAVFAQYGYRRASMGDIARAAGMSRPALYLHFCGKEHIAQSLVTAFYEDACQSVKTALDGQGSIGDLLAAAFRAKSGKLMETLLSSPHGEDMLEIGNVIAADEAAEGRSKVVQVIADWLARMDCEGRIRLDDDATQMADSMIAALEGAKASGRAPDYPAYLAHLDRMARVFGTALQT